MGHHHACFSVQSVNETHHGGNGIQRFAGWLNYIGEGKWAVALKGLIRLGCLLQRLTVYTVATVNSHLPIALDSQLANLCPPSGLLLLLLQLLTRFENILAIEKTNCVEGPTHTEVAVEQMALSMDHSTRHGHSGC